MTTICTRCNRPYRTTHDWTTQHGIGRCDPVIGVYVVHGGYGCDSGCCGHQFYAVTARGDTAPIGEFDFEHDPEIIMDTLRKLADQYHAEIQHDRCEIQDGDRC